MAENMENQVVEQKKTKKPIFKKWWFWVIIVLVVLVIALCSGDSGDANDTGVNNEDTTSGNKIEATTELKSETTIGNYEVEVVDAILCKDYEGKDTVIITYNFTNNSSNPASFDLALDAKAYQDGIGLENAYVLEDKYEDTDTLIDVEIKPGVTKEVRKAYLLRDNVTDIEIEITELISFDDESISFAVSLPK